MNAAYSRGEAFVRLEHYAGVIVLYLALVAFFPDAQEVEHWKAEIRAFRSTIQRYDNAKGSRKHNFKPSDIVETLVDVMATNDQRDYIANDIMAQRKGLAVDAQSLDWTKVERSIQEFAKDLFS